MSRRVARSSLAALLMLLAAGAAAHADSPTTRPVPLRTVTVTGEASKSFTPGVVASRKQAELDSYEAALADAKDRATRAAKVLGIAAGPPISAETTFTSDAEREGVFVTNVRVVFELRE